LILIDKLLISTNLPTQYDIDQAWSKEVERRCQELDSGKARLIPGEEVFEKIKKRFSK
jgi:putative addiction module component (TIGR02574 family)